MRKRLVQIAVRLPEWLHGRLKSYAAEEKISMNQLAVLAIEDLVRKKDALSLPDFRKLQYKD